MAMPTLDLRPDVLPTNDGRERRHGEPARRQVRPELPTPRGPMSGWLVERLGSHQGRVDDSGRTQPAFDIEIGDSVLDEDVQLALYIAYELSYRGFASVDDDFEWDLDVIALRRRLETAFENDLGRQVASRGLIDGATCVDDVLSRHDGPSLSAHIEQRGTRLQFEEFCIHRSGYQLKEADPHSWALPRLGGFRKAALVEIQVDEYGGGTPGDAHADLFGDVLASLDLDPRYGAYVERLPAVTLATTNLISMLGLQRRLLPAVLGHLAAFEMTSVLPMTRYRAAVDRLNLGDVVGRFFDVHIDADVRHGSLAASRLAGEGPDLPLEGICFGAAALLVVEDHFARHLLRAWGQGESSLR